MVETGFLRWIGRPRTWSAWARTYLCVFRVAVVGLCVVGATFGWIAHIPWLLAASCCIGVGELLESSYYLAVLEWGERSGRMLTRDSAGNHETSG